MSITHSPVLLESGDRLSRDEFHRRFCLRPDIKKAELVGGIVFVPSPARLGVHGRQQADAFRWLDAYAQARPGLECAFDVTVFLDADTEVMPDVILFADPAPPGGAVMRDDNYVWGVPQLVVEIAASTVSVDLHDKKQAYERAGVHEYLVWRVQNEQFDWFRLRDGKYERVEPDADGIIESDTFPGLRLHIAKLLAGDRAGVLAELHAPPAG